MIDPNSPVFLNVFADLLTEIKPEIEQESFTQNASVLWEDGPDPNDFMPDKEIDFYIEENNRCIIVENKITDHAGDQPNQLGRYIESARYNEKDVISVAYLPLYYKEPPNDNYEYIIEKLGKEACEEFRKKLVILQAMDTDSKCLTKDFLDQCVALAKEYKGYTVSVCIEQYSQFVKHNGGREKMAEGLRKKLLKKV